MKWITVLENASTALWKKMFFKLACTTLGFLRLWGGFVVLSLYPTITSNAAYVTETMTSSSTSHFFLHLEFVPPLATLHALFILFATKWYCPLQWRPSQVSLWYVECLLPLASLVYVSSQTSEALCAFTLLFFYDYVYLLIFTSHSRCTFMFFFFSGSTWTYLCVRFGCFQKLISLHDVIVGISLTFCFVSPQYQSLRLKLKNKRSGVCVCLREGHTYAHLFPVLFWDRVHCAKHV